MKAKWLILLMLLISSCHVHILERGLFSDDRDKEVPVIQPSLEKELLDNAFDVKEQDVLRRLTSSPKRSV